MYKKTITLAIVSVFSLLATTTATLAQSALTAPKSAVKEQNDKLSAIRTRGDTEINRRIEKLSSLIPIVASAKRLSTAQKSQYTTDINAEINSLTALRSQIDSAPDVATARTKVKSIVSEYRVFMLYMPRIRMLASVDSMEYSHDHLSEVAAKLNQKVTEASRQGKDVKSLQEKQTDLASKLSDAKSHYEKAETAVAPLTPQQYPQFIDVLKSARDSLKESHEDVKAARDDAKYLAEQLKAIGN